MWAILAQPYNGFLEGNKKHKVVWLAFGSSPHQSHESDIIMGRTMTEWTNSTRYNFWDTQDLKLTEMTEKLNNT